MFSSLKRVSIIVLLSGLLLLMSGISLFQVHAVTKSSTKVTNLDEFTPVAFSEVQSLKNMGPAKIGGTIDNRAWAGYDAYVGSEVYGVSGAWMIPQTTCNPSSPYPQLVGMLAWLDGLSAKIEWSGIVIVCDKGASTPIYALGDATQTYTTNDISAGDVVTAYTYYDPTNDSYCFNVQDWSSGVSQSDCGPTGIHAPLTDGAVVVTTFTNSECTTPSGICPLADFKVVDQGTGNSIPVYCEAPVPEACVAIGVSNFYPLGQTPSATIYKFILTNAAENKTDATVSGFVSGSEDSAWTTTFKHPGP